MLPARGDERGLEPPLSTMDRARPERRGHGGMAGRGQAGREGTGGPGEGLPTPWTPETAAPPRGAGRGAGLARWLSLLRAFIASVPLYFP